MDSYVCSACYGLSNMGYWINGEYVCDDDCLERLERKLSGRPQSVVDRWLDEGCDRYHAMKDEGLL